MKLNPLVLCLSGVICMSPPSLALAQERADTVQAQQEEALRVFLDCQAPYCDFDHFRREIPFVNWVRDRQDGELHVLVTARRTGGGGWEFTFNFIGLRELAGREDTLQYISDRDDTADEVRAALTQTLKLGLMRYVAETLVAQRIRITYQAATEAAPAGPVEDPWNLWVFRTGVGTNLNGESERRFAAFNGSLNANRTAEDLKIDLNVFGRYSRDETDVPELDTTFVNIQERYNFGGLVVWSIGQHWAAGVQASVSKSTFVNQDLAVRGGPAIEYNIYPYEESTRRQLTFMYSAGPAAFDYEKKTTFGETSEVRPVHRMDIGLGLTQPWGSIHTSLSASQFLHDLSKHNVGIFGSVNIRLIRGLSFRIFGNFQRIKDQLYIPEERLTPEERLQGIRQFGTDFRYFARINFNFQFGSKLANIVNPRMGGGGGFFFF